MIQKKLMDEKKAVKLIDPTISASDAFTQYNILPFDKLVRLEQCKLGYKLCNNLLPLNLARSMKQDHRMQSITKSHNYPMRSKEIPNLPQASTNKYRSSFLFRAIKEFSALNSTLKTCKTLNTFSYKCKKYLMSLKTIKCDPRILQLSRKPANLKSNHEAETLPGIL